MEANPYVAPQAVDERVGERPLAVTIALVCLLISTALWAWPLASIFPSGLPSGMAGPLFSLLVVLAINAGLTVAIYKRRNWARWVLAVLTGFYIVVNLQSLVSSRSELLALPVLELGLTWLDKLAPLAATVLLFTGPSSHWFTVGRRATSE